MILTFYRSLVLWPDMLECALKIRVAIVNIY
jgi:hypothetical protein